MFRSALRALAIGAVVASAPLTAFSEAIKDLPRPTDYVSDIAHVMSPEAKVRVNRLCGQLDHEAHAQIAVVLIKTTDGEPIQQYAVALEDAWKVGNKQDRGAILLLAVNDRKRWIETGYGLEGILPDAKVGQIGREMIPALRANDFDTAVTQAVDQMAQIIATDAGVTLQPLTRRVPQQPQPMHLTIGHIIGGIVVLILLIVFLSFFGSSGLLGFLLGMFFGGGPRGGGFGGGGGWGGGDGGGGGGGSDGGSGFDGFGGGSTGGGGAGGDW